MTTMNKTMRNSLGTGLIVGLGVCALACGGTPKGGGTGPDKDPNGEVKANPDGTIPDVDKPKPKIDRTISKDAENDFKKAVAYYKAKKKEGWTEGNCSSAAEKFKSVASDHNKLVEARFNAGVAYQQCGMYGKAEKQYQKALGILSSHAPSISNLGEIYWARGNHRKAEQNWSRAIKIDSKLIAARNNMAWVLLERIRKTRDRATWKKLEKTARDHLSSVLAVDQANVKAYVIYGLIYLEGSERNKSRLDLAKLLLDEAAKRKKDYAPLHNARGLLYMRKKSLGFALEKFQQAVKLDPGFLEARMNVGLITLGFRKYDEAHEQFTAVLAKDGNNYDALVGLGIAQRAKRQLDEAEATYKKARKVDGKRGDAIFNLGVLYKDFRANQQGSDLKASQNMYRKAQSYFNEFLGKSGISASDRKEAKDNIKDCKKVIKQIDDVMKQLKET